MSWTKFKGKEKEEWREKICRLKVYRYLKVASVQMLFGSQSKQIKWMCKVYYMGLVKYLACKKWGPEASPQNAHEKGTVGVSLACVYKLRTVQAGIAGPYGVFTSQSTHCRVSLGKQQTLSQKSRWIQ